MLDKLKSWLAGPGASDSSGEEDDSTARLALAALLVEAALMDGDFTQEERAAVTALLQRRFDLGETDCGRLVARAEAAQAESAQLYQFTRTLNDELNHAEKIRVVEMLWSVAYADGTLDPYEDLLIRRTAGLLHVTDRERGDARKRALAPGESGEGGIGGDETST
ncbi:MAG: TerB family tellurite resistance protein [Alphaproteobacteria bacterium]